MKEAVKGGAKCGDREWTRNLPGGRFTDVAAITVMCMLSSTIMTTESWVAAALCSAVLVATALVLGLEWSIRDELMLLEAHRNSLEDDMKLVEIIESLEGDMADLELRLARAESRLHGQDGVFVADGEHMRPL